MIGCSLNTVKILYQELLILVQSSVDPISIKDR